MQYYSLLDQTLLSPLDTFTTECHFCFDPATSFYLGLFLIALCFSPLAYWTLSDLGGGCLNFHIYFPFHTVHGLLMARILKWVMISYSSGPRFVRTLHYDPSILGVPVQHGS